ncbi:MAG: hypothetical protein WDN30_10665 [Pararobbsia sp.]
MTSPISGIASQQLVTEAPSWAAAPTTRARAGTLLTTVVQIDSFLRELHDERGRPRHPCGRRRTPARWRSSSRARRPRRSPCPAASPTTRPARLDFSDVIVNATTGAVNLRALVANPKHALLPGMYVTLTLNLGQQNNVYLVPPAGPPARHGRRVPDARAGR